MKVRITVGTNILNPKYALVNSYALVSDTSLAKAALDELTLRGPGIVTEYALNQNYPNPFNPSTEIDYALPVAGNVLLVRYDVLGREVTTLAKGYHDAGRYTAHWNAGAIASGAYFARLTVVGDVGNNLYTKNIKMLL